MPSVQSEAVGAAVPMLKRNGIDLSSLKVGGLCAGNAVGARWRGPRDISMLCAWCVH